MRATRRTTRPKAGPDAQKPIISSARKSRTAEQIASSNAKRKATIAARKEANRTFPRFNELPKELRLMIWEAALPQGRVVSIKGAALKYTVREWNDRVDKQALRDGPETDKKDEPYLAESLVNKTYLADGAILNLLKKGVGFIRLQNILGMSTANKLKHFLHTTTRDEFHFTGRANEYESIETRLARRVSGIKSSQAPPILFACKESRTVTLNAFPRYSSMSFSPYCAIPETCFDGQKDTLYICDPLDSSVRNLSPGLGNTVTYLTTIEDVQTLSKIEHLAILLNRGKTLYTGYYWDGLLPYLDDLLRNLRGIKKLTFVVRHFGKWGTDTNEEVSFIDPMDFESQIRAYETCSAEIEEEDSFRAAEMPHQDYDFKWARLDSQSVAFQNILSIQAGKSPLVYPPIEYKMAITSSYKMELDRLEKARNDCQARCNAHNLRLMKSLETSIKS